MRDLNKRTIAIFFSATDTTKKYVDAVVSVLGNPADIYINIADDMGMPLPEITPDDLVIVASPVYGGRLPEAVAERFKELRGNGAVAIPMVIYGNRDYDDALLELLDILSAGGFRIVGAGAFIGQHSIFPLVAKNRPDESDMEVAREFASECRDALENSRFGDVHVKGNRPYKKIMNVGLIPKVDKNLCNRCGQCASNCPAEAIDKNDPTTTADDRCISCGRCIAHCPRGARKHKGMKYSLIGAVFTRAFSKRKEAEYFML